MTWSTATVICAVCSHKWQAVIEGAWEGDPPLECPECGSSSGILAEGDEETMEGEA
jgi:DNA-directed RNA polymerase subunit RPC12/RpoP